jgi:competence protein ComEA
MREFFRQFMLYSRSERRAVVSLGILIVVVVVAPLVYRFYFVKQIVTYNEGAKYKDLLAVNGKYSDSSGVLNPDIDSPARHQVKLFYFDPNNIGVDDWKKLGLSERQAAVIEKYKSKGGRFRTAEDIRKIYVLSDEMKEQLIPYIKIEAAEISASSGKFYKIEINKADSAAFEELDGIGPYLASRIVKYRSSLGGFYSIEQVGEAHGMNDTIMKLIRAHLTVDPTSIRQINVNTAEYEELRKHPYIHAKIAHALVSYRNMNGKIENVDQLRGIKPMTDEQYEKIKHYISVK